MVFYFNRKQTALEINERVWSSISEENRKKRVTNARQGVLNYWKNLSEEDKQKWFKNQQKGFQDFLDNLSEKEIKDFNSKRGKGFLKLKEKLSEKELKEFYKQRTKKYKEWYNSLSKEEKQERSQKKSENNRKFWSNMTLKEFKEWNHKRKSNQGKKHPLKVGSKILQCDSSWEVTAYKTLKNLNVDFLYSCDPDNSTNHYKLANNSYWIPDFEIKNTNIIIEVKANRGPVCENFMNRVPVLLKSESLKDKIIYILDWNQKNKETKYKNLNHLLNDCIQVK